MLFRKSQIALSAAVILALNSESYITASLFFILGLMEQKIENDEDYRRRRIIQDAWAVRDYKEKEEEYNEEEEDEDFRMNGQ